MSGLRWVLDTNVVLDWLVWNHPFMTPLRERITDGRVIVLTHAAAIDELQRVLGYRQLKLTPQRQHEIFQRYLTLTVSVALPVGSGASNFMLPVGFPRCRDRDDQHFIALAYHQRADALVSRDNAVCCLKLRAEKFGVSILNVRQAISALVN